MRKESDRSVEYSKGTSGLNPFGWAYLESVTMWRVRVGNFPLFIDLKPMNLNDEIEKEQK